MCRNNRVTITDGNGEYVQASSCSSFICSSAEALALSRALDMASMVS